MMATSDDSDRELTDEDLEQVIGGSRDMKIFIENWRRSSTEDWRTKTNWAKGEEKITLGEVHAHLGNKTVDISVSSLAPLVRTQKPVDGVSLDYPIIVNKSGGQYQHVLDGNHRLQKAIDQRVESIKAKILDLDNPETPEIFVRMFGGTK